MIASDALKPFPGGARARGTTDIAPAARKRAWTLPSHASEPTSVLPVDCGHQLRSPREAEHHRDTFLDGVRPALTIAQVFGLLPVARPSDAREASFRWRSPRVVWCCSIILGAAFLSVFALIRMFETGINYYSSVNAVFFVMMTVSQLMFLHLSTTWRDLVLAWAHIESTVMSSYGQPVRLRLRMVLTTAVALTFAIVEHSLSIASTLAYVWPCYTKGGANLLFQGYFLTKYLKTFTLITYSMWKAVVVLALQIICVFLWNFLDLFVTLFAIGLAARFRQINTALKSVEGQAQSNEFWMKKRKAYNALAGLVQKVDDKLGPIIMMAFACDLYFICLQLLSIVNPSHVSTLHDTFFYFSMTYLFARASYMSYVASNVHEESRKPREVLYSVPSEGYTVEVQRFLTQVTTDHIALTGCNFFTISRSLMLKVAGTIVTYVIVLVQFGDKDANPDVAQSNGTVSCTCEDIKVYTC